MNAGAEIRTRRSSCGACIDHAYSLAELTPFSPRILIAWSRKMLSERSGVPIKTTEALERGTTAPKMSVEYRWRRAFERASVVFIEEDGPVARWRERRKTDAAP